MNLDPQLPLADVAPRNHEAARGHAPGAHLPPTRVLGLACGLGAPDPSCAQGPPALYRRVPAHLARRAEWAGCFTCEAGPSPLAGTARAARLLARGVHRALGDGGRCLVLAGDHAYAAGTWAGAAAALRPRGPLGLVWVDAHLDCHTPATSPSGNLHGMPLAALLGQGRQALTRVYGPEGTVAPANVAIVGVRSYEAEEAELVRRLGVRVFAMEEVDRRGLDAVMAEALAVAGAGTAGFGVSLDLDAVDPDQAPGVTCPAPGGLDGCELAAAVAEAAGQPGYLGVELAEYTPARDRGGRTAGVALSLMAAALGGKGTANASRG